MTTISRFLGCDMLHLRDDGRTVEGCLVPYGKVAEVIEPDEEGNLVKYREQFLPGSCALMAQGMKRGNAAWVKLVLDHDEDSLDSYIGHCTELRSEDDGAWGKFRLYGGKDLEKVQSMLQESHRGLSLYFGDHRPPKMIDGVVSRTQVVIKHVAATPVPVYAGAGITSMRATDGTLSGTPELAKVKELLAELRGHG